MLTSRLHGDVLGGEHSPLSQHTMNNTREITTSHCHFDQNTKTSCDPPNSETENIPSVDAEHVKLENGGPSKRKCSSRAEKNESPETTTEIGA